jgi:hypothetical protein
MSDDITPKEWEAMSAYLDGQSGRKERERLERSLEQNPALSEALKGLRETRLLLRNQPKIRASRNFTLSPEMVGVGRESSISGFSLPVLRMVSILASVLFVVIIAGDLLASGSFVSDVPFRSVSEQESALMEKAAPQLAMPEEAIEEIETGQADSSRAFEMEQPEPAPEFEMEAPARMMENVPQRSSEIEEAGGDAVVPEAVDSHDADKLSAFQEFHYQKFALRFFELFLLVVAITAGVGAIYLNRRSQERE